MPNPLARCQLATKNTKAALLIYRLAYWMPKARIKRDGFLWVARSRSEWCDETGLSIDQYNRALRRLKDIGLVVAEQHLFAGKNVTHMRITELGQKAIGAGDEDKACSNTEGVGCSKIEGLKHSGLASHECSESATLYTQGDTYKEVLHGESGTTPAKGSEGLIKKKGYSDKNEVTQKSELTHKPSTPSSWESLWRQTIFEVYGEQSPAFTGKQWGQLKHFVKACPQGTAFEVMKFCLQNWALFSIDAKSAAGLKKSPERPDLGFLLKHVGPAVNAWNDSLKPKTMVASPAKAAKAAKVATPKLAKTSKKDPPATYEEIMEILNS